MTTYLAMRGIQNLLLAMKADGNLVFNTVRSCSTKGSSSKPSSAQSSPSKTTAQPSPPKTSAPKASTAPKASAASKTSTQTSPNINIPVYTSKATPTPPNQPVGPGALKSGEYKNPEYFCYDQVSFYDLEVEMVKDRLPQPKANNEHL